MQRPEFHYSAFATGNGWAITAGQVWRATVGSSEIRHVLRLDRDYIHYKGISGHVTTEGGSDRRWWRDWARQHDAMVTPSGKEPVWFPRMPTLPLSRTR